MSKIIAVTGKGGTGKTTLAGLMLKYLKEHTPGPILALDADPDANLATVLGVTVEKTIGDLREETLKNIKEMPAGMSKSAWIEAGLHEVIVEGEKVDLVTMGRSEGPGCYCYINSLLRKFADDIHDAYKWIVMDNEAGLEHLSRRTASSVDDLIVVVSQNPLSVDCARSIEKLIADVKNEVRRKHIVINGVEEGRLETVKQRIEGIDMQLLGSVPPDPELDKCIFEGRSIYELDRSPAVDKMDELMSKLVD